MTIGARLLLLLLGALAVGAATAASVGVSALTATAKVESIVQGGFRSLTAASEAEAAFDTLVSDMRVFLEMTDLPDLPAVQARFAAELGTLETAIGAIEAGHDEPRTAAAVQAARAAKDAWVASARLLIGLDQGEAIPTAERLSREEAALAGAIDQILATQADVAMTAASDGRRALMRAILIAAAAGAAAMLVGGAVAFVMVRRIGLDLRALSASMERLARGDLDLELRGARRKDEIGAMARAVGVFQNALRERAGLERAQEAEREREAARMQGQDLMFRRLSDVVEAGVRGDFGRRMADDGLDAEQRRLAEAVNRLLGVVDAGVGSVATLLNELARANLSARMEGRFDGAFGRLQSDAASAATRLGDALAEVQRQSRALQDGTLSLSEGSGELKRQTGRQAEALSDAGGNLDSVWDVVQRTTGRSRTAVEATDAAVQSAAVGQKVMDDTVAAMSAIEEASRRIAEIVGVIDSIAFQTNLLALNAAVEAARAGETGKGFAVVASEVRTLALRCTDAARDISGLVAESSRRVDSGTALAREAGVVLSEIRGGVSRMADVVREIAGDSDEIARAVDAVRGAIRQLDDIAARNVAVADETNRTVEAFEALAHGLAEVAGVFRIDVAGGGARRAA